MQTGMTAAPLAASPEEVDSFLAETSFEAYQSVPLPHGRHVPGADLAERTQQILGCLQLDGATVLDVGTYYGLFPYESLRRGAKRAVGVELDARRFAVARRIAELHGGSYEIRHGGVGAVEEDDRFDFVLLLNVLHHMADPVNAVLRLAAACRNTMVVEFCRPDDPEYLVHWIDCSETPSAMSWWRARLHSMLLRAVFGELPIMAVGNRAYHRTFYFSPQAFRNLFTLHYPIFDRVDFVPSANGQRRVVAFCHMKSEQPIVR